MSTGLSRRGKEEQGEFMLSHIADLLWLHSLIMGFILLVFGLALARRSLFRWTTAGFWSWSAFTLYFFLNPLFSLLGNDLWRYAVRLNLSGGIARGQWISFVAAVGIVAFFTAYLGTKSHPVTWKLRLADDQISTPVKLVMAGFIAFATYSLLVYRARLLTGRGNLLIENGRFIGETTSYEYGGHIFLFIPLVLLILSPSRLHRSLGWLIGGLYIILSLSDEWARYTIVSILLAMLLADMLQRDKSRPRIALLISVVLMGAVLQARGHNSLTSSTEFYKLAVQVPGQVNQLLASGDTAMLATWHLESYIKDTVTGYDYGLPFLNYVLFGAIPSAIFPQKYFLVDWLRSVQPPVLNPVFPQLMYGAKSSLMGSFYRNGGLIFVIFEMGLAGIFSRKLDGMLAKNSPLLVRAIGVSWLSLFWIVWGSSDSWAAIQLGSVLMPALAIWLVSPKADNLPAQGSRIVATDHLGHRHHPVVSTGRLSTGEKYFIHRKQNLRKDRH